MLDIRNKSQYFKDGKFSNIEPLEMKSLWEFLKMRVRAEYSSWPSWINTEYKKKPVNRVARDEFHIRVINHATVLIQGNGYNIITDPIYSERCSPIQFLGPKRVRNPGIRFEDLPKIDIIAISHDHYDHLDLPTLNRLINRDNPQIFVGLGVKARFTNKENIHELDWYENINIADNLDIHFIPVNHFSGRTLFDRNSTLWGGFVFILGNKKIYFAGDSGYGTHYKKIFEKFGPMDVALLPIGAYEPKEFMGPVHMDPAEAVKAHIDLNSKQSIGIHYGTFQLTAESIDAPKKCLEEEIIKAGLARKDFITPEFGEVIIVSDTIDNSS